MVRKLYDWVLGWAKSPYGVLALFILAFAESSFFPIPPDVLLIALALGRPRKALFFGAICLVGSVSGGLLGYYIGATLIETVGKPIIAFYHAEELFIELYASFNEHSVITILLAAVIPIPYKIFTITAGVCNTPMSTFVVTSLIGRGIRFFAVAGLIAAFGPKIESFIDRYFNRLACGFGALLIGGFIVVAYVI